MTTNFLGLTNRILKAFNEVPLDSSTFAAATGFHAEAQDAINQAIFDTYTYEDTEWPFLWSNTTINTVIGQTDYTRVDTYTKLNWDSFRINRGRFTASSLTQSAGTATFTATAAHNAITGDIITILGATPSGYNLTASITVTGATTFTYPVDSTLTSPATGTITAISCSVLQSKLQLKAWDQYTSQLYWDADQNTDPTGYGKPLYIVRKPDNNLYFGMPPDRVYTMYYEGFTLPSALALYNDTSLVPTPFEQVVVDKALHYCYMFRDNIDEASLVEKRYEDNITKMRRILIPQETYGIATD